MTRFLGADRPALALGRRRQCCAEARLCAGRCVKPVRAQKSAYRALTESSADARPPGGGLARTDHLYARWQCSTDRPLWHGHGSPSGITRSSSSVNRSMRQLAWTKRASTALRSRSHSDASTRSTK